MTTTNMFDWRNIDYGTDIPVVGMRYVDQPYVVKLADGAWLCMMTLGTLGECVKGSRNYSAVTVSRNRGRTWSSAMQCICADAVGPDERHDNTYAVPLVTDFGRVYALTPLSFSWSDDGGLTWSAPRHVPVYPAEWHGWCVSKPIIAANGTMLMAWARIGLSSPPRRTQVYFYRSGNILTESDPAKIQWELLPADGQGLRGPAWAEGKMNISEEPHLVQLSDGTLYCVFRTDRGHIAHAVSSNLGAEWSPPAVLRYNSDDPRPVKHPLACPNLWKCGNGKYLLWTHNHSGLDYRYRNPAWLCGGVEDGRGGIRWSQPEIFLYSDDLSFDAGRISYPGFLEDDGCYFLFETQKTRAKAHEIPPEFLERLWAQAEGAVPPLADGENLLFNLRADKASRPGDVSPLPELTWLRESWSGADRRAGFTLELQIRSVKAVLPEPLINSREESGRGLCLEIYDGDRLRLTMCDGQTHCVWESDAGTVASNRETRVSIIVDGGPKLILFVVDGKLQDGGAQRQFGWGRYTPSLRHANPAEAEWCPGKQQSMPESQMRLSPQIQALRIHGRALTVSETIAYQQTAKTSGP